MSSGIEQRDYEAPSTMKGKAFIFFHFLSCCSLDPSKNEKKPLSLSSFNDAAKVREMAGSQHMFFPL